MKVLGLVVAMLLVVGTAYAGNAIVGDSYMNEQGQGQCQEQGQSSYNRNDNSNLNVTNSRSESESEALALSQASSIQGQGQGMANSGNQSTNIDARERSIRWVNVSAADLPATQGMNSVTAATPFGSIGASAETTIARQGAYANAIIAGKEMVPNAQELYVQNLQAMKKASKPRFGIITQVMKLIY